jgi:hypothetical protein
MADQKISELTALTGANLADVDAFAVVQTLQMLMLLQSLIHPQYRLRK